MDTFAHAIWSLIIFNKTPQVGWAMFFGAMPDLFSWTIYLFNRIIKGDKFEPPKLNKIPSWVFFLYGLTHSIFVFAITAGLILAITGNIPLFLWAWLIHILVDIPTHSRKFLPTPFLWPVSNWKFPGFNWGQTWFMILNWSAIIVCFIFVFF